MLIQPTMQLEDLVGKQVALTLNTGAEVVGTLKKVTGDEFVFEKVIRYLVAPSGDISPMKYTILGVEEDSWPVVTMYKAGITSWYIPDEPITKSYLELTTGIKL